MKMNKKMVCIISGMAVLLVAVELIMLKKRILKNDECECICFEDETCC